MSVQHIIIKVIPNTYLWQLSLTLKKIEIPSWMLTIKLFGLIANLALHFKRKDSMKMPQDLPTAHNFFNVSSCDDKESSGNISSHFFLIYSQDMGISRGGVFLLIFW